MTSLTPEQFVRGFRESSPYIHRFRGQTFVIAFGGDAIADGSIFHLAADIALLNSLGINIVLVHGAGPQIDGALQKLGVESVRVGGRRVTSAAALPAVKAAVGAARLDVEAALSQGVSGSPMAGAGLRVVGGNFLIAQPLGVLDGVDYQHTGRPRRVEAEAIIHHLQADEVVLLSPIGVSPTGEIFNVSAEEVATVAAIALRAAKLVFLMDEEGVPDVKGGIIRQLTVAQAEDVLHHRNDLPPAVRQHLESAVAACRGRVGRAHLVPRHRDGALLLELFTRDGLGTLVSEDPFEHVRPAKLGDVAGIIDLIRPLEDGGILVRRSRERLEMEVDHFVVTERDGKIIGCAALYPYPDEGMAEMACLAVDADYRRQGRAEQLLAWCEHQARSQGLRRIFVLSTQTTHWFRERGFAAGKLEDLPVPRQQLYNLQRRSLVFFRDLF